MNLERLTSHHRLQQPLRVALFSGNYNYTFDGANQSLNRLMSHLQRQAGVEVRIYSPTSPRPAFAPVGDLISVPSIPIPMRPDYRFALGLPARQRRDLEAFQPDLIHLSAPDLLGAAALRLARKLDVPVVASMHTLFDTYLDYYGMGWLKPFLQGRLRAFYGACDYVLAPTRAIASQLEAEALPSHIRVWGRGVDSERFNPARRSEAWRCRHGFDDARPVVVFLGRLVMEKGLAVFASIIQNLEQSHGPIPVLVIGDGPARAWFQERLPNAVFTGFLAGEALATALASGDIFLNPSTTETFGNVNLEAMASGLPLVCADVPNSGVLVRPGTNGILCGPEDVDSYSAAIARLMDDPAERARMGCEAHIQSASYQWSEILDGVVDVYREALTRPRAGRPGGGGHGYPVTGNQPFSEPRYRALMNPAPEAGG